MSEHIADDPSAAAADDSRGGVPRFEPEALLIALLDGQP
ncbi:hypothetical protein ABH922_003392 [Rhodococcus sp. 27YEA15]